MPLNTGDGCILFIEYFTALIFQACCMQYYFLLFYQSKHCSVFHVPFLSFRVNILKISFKRKKFFIQQRQKHVSSPLILFCSIYHIQYFILNDCWSRSSVGLICLWNCFVNLVLLFWSAYSPSSSLFVVSFPTLNPSTFSLLNCIFPMEVSSLLETLGKCRSPSFLQYLLT